MKTRWLIVVIFGLVSLTAAQSSGTAPSGAKQETKQSGQSQPASGSDADKLSRSAETLQDAGVRRCLSSVSNLSKFIFEEDDEASLGLWYDGDPDRHTSVTILNKPYSDGAAVAVVSGTPTEAGTCDAVFTHVLMAAQSCGTLRDTTFKDWKYQADLGGTPLYVDPTTRNAKVVLVPFQNNCLIVKTGILFFPVTATTDTKNTKKK